jgi:AcrR family transcriptional regulator
MPRKYPAAQSTPESVPEGLQAAKSRRTQDAIINAVIELITEGGYVAASSTQIARRAGVSWGAVQHHFGGKDEILQAVLSRSHDTFNTRMAAPGFSRGSLETRVSRFIDAAWVHYQGAEYTATLEILLARRAATAQRGPVIDLKQHSHLALWRSIYPELKLSDAHLQETIYTVHCLLTGLLVETVLEQGAFEPARYLKRLKRVVSGMLTE